VTLNLLATDNLITRQAAAIEGRLRTLFPAGVFDFAHLPAALTLRVWTQSFRRMPAIGLQFAGLNVDSKSGRIPRVSVDWRVFLVTHNPAGAAPRLLGDTMGPGLAGMAALAVLALHGLTTPEAGTAAAGNLDTLGADWLDESVAAAGLALTFGPMLLIDPTAADGLADFLRHGPTWAFGATDPALTAPPFPVR
jgi:hypothetical protein